MSGPIPLARAGPAELQAEVQAVMASPIVRAMLDALGGGALVLDAHRQIVASDLRSFADGDGAPNVIGLRPGEALGCVHATERPEGCGAADACRTCDALRVILGCQGGEGPLEGECAITTIGKEPRSLDLRLRATPVEVDGRPYTVLGLRDAADENRRAALEQVFFHDLLNDLTTLSTTSQMLLRMPEEKWRETADRVARLVKQVESDILGQRALLQAERGTLELTTRPVRTGQFLSELSERFSGHPLSRGRALSLEPSADVEIETDPSLLSRVLANMVTNALEATPEGGRVQIACWDSAGAPWACLFQVQNPGVISRPVAGRIFERTFSTKARKGRGLGTYGMKLIGERYLGGEVSFTSGPEQGTVFSLRLPRQAPSASRA